MSKHNSNFFIKSSRNPCISSGYSFASSMDGRSLRLISPFCFSKRFAVENFIDAACHPMRVEDVRVLKARVVLIVKCDAEVVQVKGQRLLRFRVCLTKLRTLFSVLPKAQIIALHPGQFVFYRKPSRRERDT